ncbi:hypothetical protein [Streptomyces pseudovenezuelae]|uniref:Secreted protein n=1 Tax=Streptomyces pseudovenezuelae TaxID=67350 RepID=A0ABT6M2D9_9ACTN|nr:hypothetical protein [Streptomyces pseudovenezuelae]MDH6222693.1 hypothetical protein [Streptomyces pseudovenezuelae]
MSPLVSRGLLLPSLLCAALVFGPVVGTASAQSSVPGASTAAGAQDLGVWLDDLREGHGTAAADPLLGVLSDLTERSGRPLGAEEAAAYTKAVETAYASLRQRVQERPAAAPDSATALAAADPIGDAVTQLQSAVDKLVSALSSLDLGGVLGAVTGLLSPVLSLITGVLGSAVPSVPALPSLPALPTPGSPAQ